MELSSDLKEKIAVLGAACAVNTVWSFSSSTATCTLVRVVPSAAFAVPVSAMPLPARTLMG